MPDNFTCLHISDLHVGMSDQGWLWPGLKGTLFNDLNNFANSLGKWDVVIFSGDLVQKGDAAEYAKLTNVLTELWEHFSKLGQNPAFVFVPGNHDLVRPPQSDPGGILLQQWWTTPQVSEGLWKSGTSNLYMQTISRAFENFTNWSNSLDAQGIKIIPQTRGLLPGDFSTTIEIGGNNIGIVGLNSTWLQLSSDDYRGKLCVDPRQLHSVTEENPQKWCDRNIANILVTHHPSNWLHPSSLSHWNAEINPPGRFLHLHGHMHVPEATALQQGGAQARLTVQAASLFGLERIDSVKLERIHGYAVTRISFDRGSEVKVWPRIVTNMTSGERKLTPDVTLTLSDDNSFILGKLKNSKNSETMPSVVTEQPAEKSQINSELNSAQSHSILERTRYALPHSQEHDNVRKVEQSMCIASIKETRTVWIVADWGAGADGFISSIQKMERQGTINTYRIELGEYISREDFLLALKQRLSASLEQFCASVAGTGPAYLILDEAPVSSSSSNSGTASVELEVEDIVRAITQFCSNLKVFIRTRFQPVKTNHAVVHLKPLDEADLKTYVLEHRNGGEPYGTTDAVTILFRHTDGIPARIDAALRELEVTSLENLSNSNIDLTFIGAPTTPVAPGLAKAISSLQYSPDHVKHRAYSLLRGLSIFPLGETIERVKRLYGPHPIFPTHAMTLIDIAVAQTTPTATVSGMTPGQNAKLIVIPRPIRDYMLSQMSTEEVIDLTKKAAAIYFGDGWSYGQLKPRAADRFKNQIIPSFEIVNSSAIIIRLIHIYLQTGDKSSLESTLDLSIHYAEALIKGDHYGSSKLFCQDLISSVSDEHQSKTDQIKYALARSLRMLGKNQEACDLLVELQDSPFLQGVKARLFLTLALCYQALKQDNEAQIYAKKTMALDKLTLGLQAKAILFDYLPDGPDKNAKMLSHEATCRKKGAHVVANNMALDRALLSSTSAGDAEKAIDDVIRSQTQKADVYNAYRAVIKRVRIRIKQNAVVSTRDRQILLEAYHYLFAERLKVMFDNCNEALWELFEAENDSANLFALFRHSSLIWRLRGDEAMERKYLRKLARFANDALAKDLRSVSREIAYYFVRASTADNLIA